jgi:purine-cytosine permease-like protein
MSSLFGYLCIVLIALVLVLGIASRVTSTRFFKRLEEEEPSSTGLFPGGVSIAVGHASQPLPSARMRYLKDRRYRSLADPTLHLLGRRAWLLLTTYAVAFIALVFSALLWGYFRANGP